MDVTLIEKVEIIQADKKAGASFRTLGEVDAEAGDNERKYRVIKSYEPKNLFLGKVPVMVRSQFCQIRNLEDNTEITRNAKECTYDQGGYFIINGSEKVIIANERMASNIVLVFHKK